MLCYKFDGNFIIFLSYSHNAWLTFCGHSVQVIITSTKEVMFSFRVPAPALNSRPALKSP